MSLSLASESFTSRPIMSTYSPLSVGNEMRLNGGAPSAAIAWTTTNQARYVPMIINEPFLVKKLLVYCGSTSGGNNDMAVYDRNANRVIGATAAAHPGSAGWQEFDVTDTWLVPGLYYIGVLNTTTTATFAGWASKEFGRAAGVFSQAVGAGTMPTPTATFAALDTGLVPIVAISSRVTI